MSASPSAPIALIAGAFGQGNPGDEALLSAVQPVVAAAGFEAVVTSSSPARTTESFGCGAVAPSGPAAARALRAAAAVVVGGGTLFKELHPASRRRPGSLLRRTGALALAAGVTGKPLLLVGVGAAPIGHRSNRALARGIARWADLMVMRDEESASELLSIGVRGPVRVGADPAWTTLADNPSGPTTGGPVIVALSHLAGDGNLAAWLADGLGPLVAAGVPVALQPWQVPLDRWLARAVARRLGPGVEVLDEPADLDSARADAVGASAVLALRFHAAVAAGAAGVPFVAVATEPKLVGIARRLDMPAVAPSAPASELTAAVEHVLAGRAVLGPAVDRERRRAEDTLTLLRLVLTGGIHWDDAGPSTVELVSAQAAAAPATTPPTVSLDGHRHRSPETMARAGYAS